jgi:hypothetical protein
VWWTTGEGSTITIEPGCRGKDIGCISRPITIITARKLLFQNLKSYHNIFYLQTVPFNWSKKPIKSKWFTTSFLHFRLCVANGYIYILFNQLMVSTHPTYPSLVSSIWRFFPLPIQTNGFDLCFKKNNEPHKIHLQNLKTNAHMID